MAWTLDQALLGHGTPRLCGPSRGLHKSWPSLSSAPYPSIPSCKNRLELLFQARSPSGSSLGAYLQVLLAGEALF